MKFILLIEQPRMSEAPSKEAEAQMMQRYGAYHQALISSGVIAGGERLFGDEKATRVTNRGGKRAMVDGPFAETKEVLGGFFLIDVKSREEALDWAAKCPGADYGTVDVRQVQEMDATRNMRP
jgi:hypothetical protein